MSVSVATNEAVVASWLLMPSIHSCGHGVLRPMHDIRTKTYLGMISEEQAVADVGKNAEEPSTVSILELLILIQYALKTVIDCETCKGDHPNDMFDLCHTCYETGRGCRNESHALTEFVAYSKSSREVLSRKAMRQVCNGPGCDKVFKAGEMAYQCSKCMFVSGGKTLAALFCYSCRSSGVGCKDSIHSMDRIEYL